MYEEIEDNIGSLENTCTKILNAFIDRDVRLTHLRYVYMAIILAEAVQPTVKAYLPDDQKTEIVFEKLNRWLNEQKKLPLDLLIKQLFPSSSEGCQAIDEALDVFLNLLRVTSYSLSKKALLEIINDCLEGYAIFPGSQGRRDVFNWWLLEVVPAAYCLEYPQKLYTIKGLQDLDSNLKKLILK